MQKFRFCLSLESTNESYLKLKLNMRKKITGRNYKQSKLNKREKKKNECLEMINFNEVFFIKY